MRKAQQKGRTVKMQLDKCKGICVLHDKVMGAVAKLLSADSDVLEFQVNIPLDFSKSITLPQDITMPKEAYCTDFVIKYTDGHMAVREAVFQKHLERPSTVDKLELSRRYWHQQGVVDWKIITEQEEHGDETR